VWRVTQVPSPYDVQFEIPGTPSSGGGGTVIAATSGNLSGPYAYNYALTYAIGGGETLLGTAASIFVSDWTIARPDIVGAPTPIAGGTLAAGTYAYAMTFETALGETLASQTVTSVALSGANNAVAWAAIRTGADERILRRKIYRSKVNTLSPLYLCGTINDNSTTIWTDTLADSSLGAQTAPEAYSAGYGAVSLYNLPVTLYSPSGTVTRNLYRSQLLGPYRLVGTLNNNTDTTFCDTKADSDLGALAPVVSAAPALIVLDEALQKVVVGDPVSVLVQCDDTAAQAALAAVEGGDGIRCGEIIVDQALSAAAARVRGTAELTIRSKAERRLQAVCLDPTIRAGQTVNAAINQDGSAPILGTFRVTSCQIEGYDTPHAPITRRIEASDLRFTPEDLFKQWEATTNWRPVAA
jgi:hypothetical protein